MFNNLNKYGRLISFESLHDEVGVVETSTFHERLFIKQNIIRSRFADLKAMTTGELTVAEETIDSPRGERLVLSVGSPLLSDLPWEYLKIGFAEDLLAHDVAQSLHLVV